MSGVGFSIFNIGVNVFETFLQLWFVTQYLTFKEKIVHKKSIFTITWFALFFQIQVLNSIMLFEGILAFINPVILCVYAFAVLQGKKLEKIFVSAIPLVSTALINSFIATIQTIMWKEHIDELIVARSYKYIVMLLITKIVSIIVFLLILRLKKKVKELPENKLWFLFVIILVTSVVSIFFIYSTIIDGCKEIKYLYYLIIAIVGILIMNIVTFYFLKRIGKETELKQEIEMLQQNTFHQQENIRNILQEQERIKKIRHDMKSVMIAIDGLAKNNDVEEIRTYCSKYMGEIIADNNVIYTGISTIDNLLAYKIKVAKDQGCFVKAEISKIRLDNISDMHVCVILGNLLDNAIEALQEVDNKNKCMHIIMEQESYISIFVKNTIDTSVLEGNPHLLTTKTEKEIHGFGIRNVRELVKQYEGIIKFYEEENMFVCHIKI